MRATPTDPLQTHRAQTCESLRRLAVVGAGAHPRAPAPLPLAVSIRKISWKVRDRFFFARDGTRSKQPVPVFIDAWRGAGERRDRGAGRIIAAGPKVHVSGSGNPINDDTCKDGLAAI